MIIIGQNARAAAQVLTTASTETKHKALSAMAASIRTHEADLLAANAQDLEAVKDKGLSKAMIDRLLLDPDRIEGMAKGLEDIVALPDPIGETIASWDRPNGLNISRVRVPLGVIGIIYESRPNVTADAGALCLKSGNASILRGGSESYHSSRTIYACLQEGLRVAGLPETSIQLVPTTDREAVGVLLRDMTDYVDVIVPRGGKNLIARIQTDARVPVMAHLEGLCHIYIDKSADPKKAVEITVNSKMRRTGICGAVETVLIDRTIAATTGRAVVTALLEAGCEVRGDDDVQALNPQVQAVTEEDFYTEYLDAIVSVRILRDVSDAIEHISAYGSNHTEAIIAEDPQTVEAFFNGIDSAILLHNASTQFADGGEFGMGAEIGIATGKLHARGPVGAAELTSYKYQVRGDGQIRP